MNYELAKKLKEAGFPQEVSECTLVWDKKGWLEACAFNVIPEDALICPTLEELIEACGKEFWLLRRNEDNTWWAQGSKYGKDDCETPTEAVAMLWLQLKANRK